MLENAIREDHIHIFYELLNSTGHFFLSIYSHDMELVKTTLHLPSADQIWELSGCKEYVENYSRENKMPVILWSAAGIVWIAALNQDHTAQKFLYVLGPMRNIDTSLSGLEKELSKYPLQPQQRREYLTLLEAVPVLTNTEVYSYALMLHKCLNGETVSMGDVCLQRRSFAERFPVSQVIQSNRERTWAMSQLLCGKLRNGLAIDETTPGDIMQVVAGMNISLGEPLANLFVGVVSFINSCVTAAVEGGVLADVACTKGDFYIERILRKCKAPGDIQAMMAIMFEDFSILIKKARTDHSLSRDIRKCCDYIQANVEETLSVKELANYTGYTKYYLSHKFNAEMHCSISNYIHQTRIERAKQLLIYSDESVQAISERLHFCSASYFARIFRLFTGVSPTTFREKMR